MLANSSLLPNPQPSLSLILLSEVVLEPVEDLTEAYQVCVNEIYIGRVFKSICLPRWMTTGENDGRYLSALDAAHVLVDQWETRRRCQENGLDSLPF
jgi:hypothetical protein